MLEIKNVFNQLTAFEVKAVQRLPLVFCAAAGGVQFGAALGVLFSCWVASPDKVSTFFALGTSMIVYDLGLAWEERIQRLRQLKKAQLTLSERIL